MNETSLRVSAILGLWIMSTVQKYIVGVALLLALLMGLFPPWMQVTYTGQSVVPAGYYLIFRPPQERLAIDLTRLLVQWCLVGIVAGGVILTVRKTPA